MNPSFSQIPVWVRYLVLDKLAKVLRIKAKQKKNNSRNDKERMDNKFMENGGVKLRNKRRSYARPESEHLITVPPCAENCGENAFCHLCEDKALRTLHLNGGIASRRASKISDVFLDVNRGGKSKLDRSPSIYSYISDIGNNNDQHMFRNPEKSRCACDTSSCQDFNAKLLHQQKHLVEDVRKLAHLVEEQEEAAERQEEWAVVAHIADTVFMYLFILTLVVSTVVIFMNVPEYSADISAS